MTSERPVILFVTSAAARGHVVVPVLAALEAHDLRVRAVDVGGPAGEGGGVASKIRRAFAGESAERKLRRELASGEVGAALCFDPHVAAALTVARDDAPGAVPVVGLAEEADDQWASTDCDRVLVRSEPVAAALEAAGVEAERILVVGAFGEREIHEAARLDRFDVRRRFNLSGTPVLVATSGLDLEVISQLTMQLSLLPANLRVTVLFDSGGDADTATFLRSRVPALGLSAKLFGVSADAPSYWRAADVIVGLDTPALRGRAALLGARLVVLESPSSARQGQTVEGGAVVVSSPLLVGPALETAVTPASVASAPAPLADGADAAAQIMTIMLAERDAVVDERLAAKRADTVAAARAVGAAAAASERLQRPATDLEDLSGGAGAAAPPPPLDPTVVAHVASELDKRIAELGQRMMAARDASTRAQQGAEAALAQGKAAHSAALQKQAQSELARMHALLAELANLEAQKQTVAAARQAAATAPPRPAATASASSGPAAPSWASGTAGADATATASYPPAAGRDIDAELAALKRRQQQGAAPAPRHAPVASKPVGSPGSNPRSNVDDALAALKRKMNQPK